MTRVVPAVGLVASLLSLYEAWIAEPYIAPLEFGASDPFRVMFMARNDLRFFTMHGTQLAAVPGPMEINTSPEGPDLTKKLDAFDHEPCERLLNYRDWLMAVEANRAYAADKYGDVKPGKTVKLVTTHHLNGNLRATYGFGVSYYIRLFGLFSIRRQACQEFESVRDPDGHNHLVPR